MKMKPHIRQAILDYQWSIFLADVVRRVIAAGGVVSEGWEDTPIKEVFETFYNNGIKLKIEEAEDGVGIHTHKRPSTETDHTQ